MIIRSLIAALLIGLSLPASADFVLVSKAYELSLGDVRLPGAAGGTVTFKECDDCDYHTIRVTAETRYEVDARPLTLEAFRKAVEPLGNDVPVTVVHHLESGTVKAIRVWP